jgi:hypothetical protein
MVPSFALKAASFLNSVLCKLSLNPKFIAVLVTGSNCVNPLLLLNQSFPKSSSIIAWMKLLDKPFFLL